jgi:hypothetical protein
MFHLVVCSLSTIDPKLDVTLLNFIEPDKAALGQDVEGLHVAGGDTNIEKGRYSLVEGKLLYRMAVDILPKEVRVAIIIAQKSGSQFSKKRES